MRPRFTFDDVDRANHAWGANCGPTALAAICGLTLDEVRPHMGDFESKRYTNPTLMFSSLRSLGVRWSRVGTTWPTYGLARIQWEGPWTLPGVPMAARYRYTHWVGAATRNVDDIGIWDVNAMANGTGWCALSDWSTHIVPFIIESTKRANGKWHVTHAIEVDRPRGNP
jgi:hypothetical protein